MGFEPTTACLEGRNSTTELLPHAAYFSMTTEQFQLRLTAISFRPILTSVVGFRITVH